MRGNPIHFAAVDHHTQGPGVHSLGEGRKKYLTQLPLRDVRRGSVFSTPRRAVAQIMFERGSHFHLAFLKATNHRFSHVPHKFRVFSEGLPKPRPPGIATHVQHGSEVPRNAASHDLFGCALRHDPNQRGVPGGGEGELLWAKCGSKGVRGSVNRIDAVERRDALGFHAGRLNFSNQFPPLLSGVAVAC